MSIYKSYFVILVTFGFLIVSSLSVISDEQNESIYYPEFNYVNLYSYNGTSYSEFPPFPPYGSNEYIFGNFSPEFPKTNETMMIQTPTYYNPIDNSPNPDYALFCGFGIIVGKNMTINGEVKIQMWIQADYEGLIGIGNPWDEHKASFKFDLLSTSNGVIKGVSTPMQWYGNEKTLIEASIEIDDIQVYKNDALYLQISFRGVGQIYVLYGSYGYPTHISIPCNSIVTKTTIEQHKEEKKVTTYSEITTAFGLPDVQSVEFYIFSPDELQVYFEIANIDIIRENNSSNYSMVYYWEDWDYSDYYSDQELPIGNFKFLIRIIDTNQNTWEESGNFRLTSRINKSNYILTIIIWGSIVSTTLMILKRFPWLLSSVPILLLTGNKNKIITTQDKYIKFIEKNGPVTRKEIKTDLGISTSAIRFHENKNKNKIKSIRVGKRLLFYTPEQYDKIKGLIDGTLEENILKIIKSHEGIKESELLGIMTQKLKIKRKTAKGILNKLLGEKVVYRKDKTMKKHYYLLERAPLKITPEIKEGVIRTALSIREIGYSEIQKAVNDKYGYIVHPPQIDEILSKNIPSLYKKLESKKYKYCLWDQNYYDDAIGWQCPS